MWACMTASPPPRWRLVPWTASFGCLGFGSCVTACQFGAMTIGPNGTAVVDPDKCTDCVRLH